MRWRHEALRILLIRDPQTKAEAARALHAGWLGQSAQAGLSGGVPGLDESERAEVLRLTPQQEAAMPGRPDRPALVPAKQVPSRSPFTDEGRAALLHAICHIEFNAIKNVFLVSISPFEMPTS